MANGIPCTPKNDQNLRCSQIVQSFFLGMSKSHSLKYLKLKLDSSYTVCVCVWVGVGVVGGGGVIIQSKTG